MNDLANYSKELIESNEGKFIFFKTDDDIDEIGSYTLDWKGNDMEGFLSIAKKLNTGLLYINEVRGGPEGREEDIGQVKLAFLYNGILHKYTESAEWYASFISELEDEQFNSIDFDEFDKKTSQDLAKEMEEFIRDKFPDDLEAGFLETMEFWKSKRPYEIRYNDSSNVQSRIKIREAESIARKEIRSAAIKEERDKLPSIVEQCTNWAVENNIAKLTKSNLKAFLLETDLTLTFPSQDAIYTQVNANLKKL